MNSPNMKYFLLNTRYKNSNLILHIAIAQFQTEEVFKRLTQGFIEMEVRQFWSATQQGRHYFVDARDGFLWYASISMTGSLTNTIFGFLNSYGVGRKSKCTTTMKARWQTFSNWSQLDSIMEIVADRIKFQRFVGEGRWYQIQNDVDECKLADSGIEPATFRSTGRNLNHTTICPPYV